MYGQNIIPKTWVILATEHLMNLVGVRSLSLDSLVKETIRFWTSERLSIICAGIWDSYDLDLRNRDEKSELLESFSATTRRGSRNSEPAFLSSLEEYRVMRIDSSTSTVGSCFDEKSLRGTGTYCAEDNKKVDNWWGTIRGGEVGLPPLPYISDKALSQNRQNFKCVTSVQPRVMSIYRM